jgi:hypothetical protein
MARSLIRTIDRWRFERPLAVALGASAAFAMWAMPAPLYAALPLVGLLLQPIGAAIVAIVLALAGWLAMRRRAPARARKVPGIHVRVARVKPAPKAEPAVRLRRADRHPDAPARAPIRAHRDLGSPFMEVDTAPPPPTVIDLPPPPPIDVTAITVAPPAPEPAPEPEPVAEVALVHAEVPFVEAPIAEPAPVRPVRGRSRADLGAMIDRLADGLASRAADPALRRPSPALVDALEELNRIAARRR